VGEEIASDFAAFSGVKETWHNQENDTDNLLENCEGQVNCKMASLNTKLDDKVTDVLLNR